MGFRGIVNRVLNKLSGRCDTVSSDYCIADLMDVTLVNGLVVDKHDDERLNGIIIYNRRLLKTEFIIALCAGNIFLFGNNQSWIFSSASEAYNFAVNKLFMQALDE